MSSAGNGFSLWSPDAFVKKGGPAAASPRWEERVSEPSPKSPSGDSHPRSVGGVGKKPKGSSEAPVQNEEAPGLFDFSEKMAEVEARARTEGYEAGYAAGQTRIAEEMAPFRQAWLDWASQIPEFEEERLEAMAPRMLAILDKAFRKILGESLASPEGVRSLLSRLVKEYAAGRTADLLVSPEDYQGVTRFDPEFLREMEGRGVRLAASPDLSDHKVELRFQDRIVSFDPEAAAGSFRGSLSRALPEERVNDGEEEKSDVDDRD